MDILGSIIAETKGDISGNQSRGDKTISDTSSRRRSLAKTGSFHDSAASKKRKRTREKENPIEENGKRGNEVGASSSEEDFLDRSVVVKLLRERREPITLFGETDSDRLSRLRRLERVALGTKELQRDTGLKLTIPSHTRSDDIELGSEDSDKTDVDDNKRGEAQRSTQSVSGTQDVDLSADGDCSKECTYVSCFVKRILKEWEYYIASISDEKRKSREGRLEVDTYKQCKQNLSPFLKLLKCKVVSPVILKKVIKIISLCDQKKYNEATEAYIDLAVGDEPWPIGVTNVGIHARKGRERINAENVAHVMNDEAQRRYITSIKRLLTFCQTHHPNEPK